MVTSLLTLAVTTALVVITVADPAEFVVLIVRDVTTTGAGVVVVVLTEVEVVATTMVD